MIERMSSNSDDERGFGIWSALMLIVLIAVIAAAAVKAITITMAIVIFIAAFIVLTLIAMLPDMARYIRISSM